MSYASEDADAAERISAALRAGGVDVFFDRNELRGGDLWDQKIRRQIQECALFMPVISRHTESRLEGYFRLEWNLAVDRSRLMAAQRVFFLPVVIDDTRDQGAVVPDAFRAAQWTRLAAGEVSPAFVARVRGLLVPQRTDTPAVATIPPAAAAPPAASSRRRAKRVGAIGVAVITVIAMGAGVRAWMGQSTRTSLPSAAAPAGASGTSSAGVVHDVAAAAFTPPPHSIAVLPFLNLSDEKAQEYFSDGLTEELLNALAEINDLQVAARTSSFAFKGKEMDIGTIARKLNVGAVLEGSVRRSGNTVRVTAQLINAVSGFHLWSHTYDYPLGDVLKLQTEIAQAVASALKANLLGDESAKIELGGTRNAAAFDAYLRGRKTFETINGDDDYRRAIGDLNEAIRLDPKFALALAARAAVRTTYAEYAGVASPDFVPENMAKAQTDARRAIELAPNLTEAHLALAMNLDGSLRLKEASQSYDRAFELGSHSAPILREYSGFSSRLGRSEKALETARRAIAIDPLNHLSYMALSDAQFFARRYREAIDTLQKVMSLEPLDYVIGRIGLNSYLIGDFSAAAASCEHAGKSWHTQWCLSLAYHKLGRRTDAEAALAAMKSAMGDNGAFQYVTVYAQWGDTAKALEWLDIAYRKRDTGLAYLKVEPLLDPLRAEPRFQAILRALDIPD